MKLSLFKRQLLITAGITLAFVVMAFALSFVVMRMEHDGIRRASPPEFIARMIDGLIMKGKLSDQEALKVFQDSSPDGGRFDLHISTADELMKQGFKREELPKEPYKNSRNEPGPPLPGEKPEVVRLSGAGDRFLVTSIDFRAFPPPMPQGPPPGMGYPPPPPPPGGWPPDDFRGGGLPPPPHGPPPGGFAPGMGLGMLLPGTMRVLLINFSLLSIAILAASAVSLFVLFYSLRRRAAIVSEVIAKIQAGDLSARFPITKTDEAGRLMLEFNKMADEIERLVQNIKHSERARMGLLQELAHDLRTPVASLKALLENLHIGQERIPAGTREELTALAVQEVEYFERLVEDLLFLAQVNEPRYQIGHELVDFNELLEDELATVTTRYKALGKQIDVKVEMASVQAQLHGDAHLFRRLVRNAVENAFSFARTRVQVKVSSVGEMLKLEVVDDGRGLTPEALVSFGEKRITRAVVDEGGRLSVGLGSVIMKTIAQLHGGQISIENLTRNSPHISDSDTWVTGARVSVLLAKAPILADHPKEKSG